MEREARRDARKDKRKLRKKARIIKESVDFERGQDPLKAMGLGLYSIVDKECMELGLTRKAMIPIIADSGGPKIGEMSQWSDKYMANFVEFRTEKGEEPELILGNSEDGFDTITGAEEISDYIRTGELSKFINLE